MYDAGEAEKGAIRPEFNRSVQIDFKGAKITSDIGVLMLRKVDERFDIIGPMEDDIDDSRSPRHTRHTIVQMIRQRVYQIAAGYEDCNDADHLRIDPALRLAIDKGHDPGAGQSMLSRLENDIFGNDAGLESLDEALLRIMAEDGTFTSHPHFRWPITIGRCLVMVRKSIVFCLQISMLTGGYCWITLKLRLE
jgi:hypothetical protein